MNITGFINNTNVLEDTKPEDIIEGERIVREVEQKTGIPLVMTTVMDGVMPDSMLDELKAPEVMKMTRTIHYAY